jgi:hypothetical protein
VTNINSDKIKFNVALRKYLHIHSFTLYMDFFVCKDDL